MELVGVNKVVTKPTIQIDRLATGTILLIETQHSIYEMTLLEPHTGMALITGGEHFKTSQEIFIDSAAWQDELYEGAIIIDYAIILISKHGNMFHTSRVKSAKIIGPNYSYELE